MNTYRSSTRIIAGILFFSHILTSCSGLVGTAQPKFKPPLLQAIIDEASSLAADDEETLFLSPIEENQPSEQTVTDNNHSQSSSPSNQMLATSSTDQPSNSIHTGLDPISKSTRTKGHALSYDQTTAQKKPVKVGDQKALQNNQARTKQTRENIAKQLINKTFTLSAEKTISFYKDNDGLKAIIQEKQDGFSQTLTLPAEIGHLNKNQVIKNRHVHVMKPEQTPDKKGRVIIDQGGLMGGMLKPDKEEEEDPNIPSPTYCYVNEEEIDEELKCMNICFNPLTNPVTHTKCDNSFCEECISKLNYKCPICRNQEGNKKEVFPPIKLRMVLKQLDNIKIKCNKCNTEMPRGDFKDHKKYCPFPCLLNCGTIINQDKLTKHDNICPNKIILCPNGCSKHIKRCELQTHHKACPKSIPIIPIITCVPELVSKYTDFSKELAKPAITRDSKLKHYRLGSIPLSRDEETIYRDVQDLLKFPCQNFTLKPYSFVYANSFGLNRYLNESKYDPCMWFENAIEVVYPKHHSCILCAKENPEKLFVKGVCENNLTDIKQALEWGADIEVTPFKFGLRHTALNFAAMSGKYNTVEFLIKHGSKVNAVNICGVNALRNCIYHADGKAKYDITANILLDCGSTLEIDYEHCLPEYRKGSVFSEDILAMATKNKMSERFISKLREKLASN